MEEKGKIENVLGNKPRKNHWTQTKIDDATKRINNEIYKRDRQAPIHIKLDDLAVYINDKITRRGIAKGLVFVQEDINKSILETEKYTMKALLISDIEKQKEYLEKAKNILKIEVWTSIRFLMINKGITPGEIKELINRQLDIDKNLDKWLSSINKAISAGK